MNGCAPGLALIERLKATRKWAIITGTTVKCTFDSGLCSGWSQATSDSFDWTVRSGKTPSRDTGPSADHSGTGKLYLDLIYTTKVNSALCAL